MSVLAQIAAFASGVPPDIYAFHCYTRNSAIPYHTPETTVLNAIQRLSLCLSHPTCRTTCTRFTPNNSEQRLPPTYYRGCWHVVSRGFLVGYRQDIHLLNICPSSPTTELYNPKTFITHAASLRQAFAHCGKFLTAASRRSLDRVSVPVWPFTLSGRLPVTALVGHYPTN